MKRKLEANDGFEQHFETEINPHLPMTFVLRLKNFYVRESYKLLYKTMMENLGNKYEKLRYFTVSGTPGIGKSVFYLYVFLQLRKKFPERTIVTASFSNSGGIQEAKQVKVFTSGNSTGESMELGDFINVDTRYPSAIHLYDGSPIRVPASDDAIMFVFTSPNAQWIKSIRKDESHGFFYLNTWTFDELKVANSILKLGIDEENLLKRYKQLGGVARYCLTTNEKYYTLGLRNLKDSCSKINSISAVKDCMDAVRDQNAFPHQLFHYVPTEDLQDYNVIFGSDYICMLINETLNNISDIDRIALIKQFNGIQQCSVLRGWLFEGLAHDTLSKGGNFTIHSLDNPNNSKSMFLQPNTSISVLKSRESLETVFNDLYFKPEASNFESVDSWYYDSTSNLPTLYVFQCTVSLNHPVKSEGLVKVLRITKLLDNFKAGMVNLKLVFVTPKTKSNSFKKQSIEFSSIAPMELLSIKGIGKSSLQKFNKIGIFTIPQAIQAYNENVNIPCKNIIADCINLSKSEEELNVLNRKLEILEQYCLYLDMD